MHNGTEMTIVFRQRVDLVPEQTLRLRPDISHTHLFDARSGLVIK